MRRPGIRAIKFVFVGPYDIQTGGLGRESMKPQRGDLIMLRLGQFRRIPAE